METALVKVLSDILLAIDSGDLAALVLLDLSAAFDMLTTQVCSDDLKHLGSEEPLYTGSSRTWSTDRQQHVRTPCSYVFISDRHRVRCTTGLCS